MLSILAVAAVAQSVSKHRWLKLEMLHILSVISFLKLFYFKKIIFCAFWHILVYIALFPGLKLYNFFTFSNFDREQVLLKETQTSDLEHEQVASIGFCQYFL